MYNLNLDPFEIYDLLKDSRGLDFRANLTKVKTWAEQEIGRPQLPVVGAVNIAYPGVVSQLSFSKPYWKEDIEPKARVAIL